MAQTFDAIETIAHVRENGRIVLMRSVVVVEVDRIADSCGYAVPIMEYVADRDVLDLVHEKRGADGYADPAEVPSLDGLPGVGRRE